MRKLCCILLCLAMGALLFTGCANQGAAENDQAPGEVANWETKERI